MDSLLAREMAPHWDEPMEMPLVLVKALTVVKHLGPRGGHTVGPEDGVALGSVLGLSDSTVLGRLDDVAVGAFVGSEDEGDELEWRREG